jgi:hypothetical protein
VSPKNNFSPGRRHWRANRADAGRIAQLLPKNNKFHGAPSAGTKDDEE